LACELDNQISNLSSLETLSLFDNKMYGQVPLALEKLTYLKELNISNNYFNGFVSKYLSSLDIFNMRMMNENGLATSLKVAIEKTTSVASDE